MRESSNQTVVLDDGQEVHVRFWPGRGRPLVLLHGLLDSGAGWNTFARATHRPCWALDLPGFGLSSLPPRARISCYADICLDALAALDVRSYVLVGHSLGGAVAARMAEKNPESAAALILLAPAGFGRILLADMVSLPGVHRVTDDSVALLMKWGPSRHLVYRLAVSNGKEIPDDLDASLQAEAMHLRKGAHMAVRALSAHDWSPNAFWKRQMQYDGTVRVLWGSRDRLLPLLFGHGKNLQAALPQAKMTVWKNMGHHPQVEEPEKLARWIEHSVSKSRRPAKKKTTVPDPQ